MTPGEAAPHPAGAPLDAVARVLRAVGGAAVRVSEPVLLKSWERNDVWRVRVTRAAATAGRPGDPGPPDSVIVKRFKSEPARGLDEWAALEHLDALGIAPASAPHFLGGDLAARCFVMEDLGEGPSLEDLLRAREPGAAARAGEALVAIARATGALHAAAREHAGEFDRRRDALAPRPVTALRAAADARRAAPAALRAWLDAAGAASASGLEEAEAALGCAAEEPGAWATLTHGDMAPSNNLRAGDGWRLLDFEYAGVRHALYDTLLWTLFCPFPLPLIERADRAYRAAMAGAFPPARDEGEYARARAHVAAGRTLDLLRWQPPTLLERDRDWAPGLTARQAVLWHLERFLAVAEGSAPTLAPIAATLEGLHRRLAAGWSAERERGLVWPAFGDDRL
jgi:hypothetical protein